tara:strand:+ start:4845 stop:5171 length:327 start_codon:yes stop_codon:yes gene_type:complete
MQFKNKKLKNLKLNGVEYMCILMQSSPGRSQSFYLRKRYKYLYGVADPHKGRTARTSYFYLGNPRSNYMGVIWIDMSAYNSKSAEMVLTPAGLKRANEARCKIGLEPI